MRPIYRRSTGAALAAMMSAALLSSPAHAQMPENYPALWQTSEAIAQVVWDFAQVFEQDGRWTGRFLNDHLDLDAYVIGARSTTRSAPEEETRRLALSFVQALFEKAVTHPSHNIVKSEIADSHQRFYCNIRAASLQLDVVRLQREIIALLDRQQALSNALIAKLSDDQRLLQRGLDPRSVEALRALFGDDYPAQTRAELERRIAAADAEMEAVKSAASEAKAHAESAKDDCRALAFWLVDSTPNDPSPLIIYVAEAAGAATIVNVESVIFGIGSAGMVMSETDVDEAAWARRVFDIGRFN